ncbi:MAG: hypothetical protein ACLPJJ_10895 [Acidocella sp.]|uniref:hypothetical protein n=1 Tax=Acidocella sp. TaxID=50710 RepID=UPI003FBDC551
MVQAHPWTGKKILYGNPNFTDKILGLLRQQNDVLALPFGLFKTSELQEQPALGNQHHRHLGQACHRSLRSVTPIR